MDPQHYTAVGTGNNRAEYSYIQGGKSQRSTAFDIKEKAEISLLIPRSLGTVNTVIEVYDENAFQKLGEISGEWQGINEGYDEYIFEIDYAKFPVGLYFVRPYLDRTGGRLYGHRWAGGIYFDEKSELTNMMQITVCDYKYAEPKKIRGGVIYHIFVDRFMRGGSFEVPDGAKLVRTDWKIINEYPEYPGAVLYNNTFWGGTLWGIIDKLDYIKSLGTTAIYLSPIFRAASNHKYDTANYMEIDPIFGGEEAFKALIKAAKKKGIEIILDGVFNHTGSDSIYFNKYGHYKDAGAYQSRKSKYYDWFDFQEYPQKYTSWWGIEILPRINPDKPECRKYFVGEGGVVEKYRNMGIYGFRLDVADELSDDFIASIKYRLAEGRDETILYGEVWEDASNKASYGSRRHYYQGAELDGVMNYPLRSGIIDFLLGRGYDKLCYALTDVIDNAPEHILHNQMNLLGTHDTERILTMLGDENVSGLNNHQLARQRMNPGRRNFAIQKLICAYTILSTVPGIPTIFYGDEAGLEGYKDPFNRMPYPWGKEDHRLIEYYQNMGRVRHENSVYKDGDFKLIHISNELLVFSRNDSKNDFVTVVNNSDERISLTFDTTSCNLLTKIKAKAHHLDAYSAGVFKLKSGSALEIN